MYNVRIENLIFIDIETASVQPNFNELDTTWQQLWQQKVEKFLPTETTAEQFYEQRAGVMAEFSKIICVSIGYIRYEGTVMQLRIKSFYEDDEKLLLQNLVETLQQIEINNNKWSFAGHNIKEFDIPFLCRRMVINNLPIPTFMDFQNMKPWETNIVDTFQYWRFGDYKNFTSLKLLAAALNVPTPKDDIEGSQVGEVYWKENGLQRIVNYCQKDVVAVANIVLKFKNLPLLNENQIVVV